MASKARNVQEEKGRKRSRPSPNVDPPEYEEFVSPDDLPGDAELDLGFVDEIMQRFDRLERQMRDISGMLHETRDQSRLIIEQNHHIMNEYDAILRQYDRGKFSIGPLPIPLICPLRLTAGFRTSHASTNASPRVPQYWLSSDHPARWPLSIRISTFRGSRFSPRASPAPRSALYPAKSVSRRRDPVRTDGSTESILLRSCPNGLHN